MNPESAYRHQHLPRLLTDVMLGPLTRWLRTAGFDTEMLSEDAMSEDLQRGIRDARILVTRRPTLPYAESDTVVLRSDRWREQFAQVVVDLGVRHDYIQPLTRCNRCNTLLDVVSKERVRNMVPPFVYETQTRFSFCARCQQPYWQGTHVQRILKALESLFVDGLVACHACGVELPPERDRYRATLATQVVSRPLAITKADMAEDHGAIIDALLKKIEGMSAQDLEDGVATHCDFVLCPTCHRRLLVWLRSFLAIQSEAP